MFPVIISIGPFVLYSYSIFLFLAVFFGLFVVWKRGNELHFEPKELFDVVFNVFLWMFVGARIGYVLIHFNDIGFKVWEWINIFGRPGWYYPVGIISGWYAICREAKKRKWEKYQLSDLLVTGLVLAQAILALGAFFAGVGNGVPTSGFLGVKFSGLSDKRLPVQLIETVGLSASFWYLWWVEGVYRTFSWYKRNRSQAQTGYITAMYLIMWGGIKLVATALRTPEMVVAGWARLDLAVPAVIIVCGGIELLKRMGILPNSIWHWALDYFGLAK